MSLRSMLMAAAGASDTVPDTFSIPDYTNAEIYQQYTKTALPVGYDETTWFVTGGGEGSNNGSNWGTSGSIKKGETFYIRRYSSNSYSNTLTSVVTFGNQLTVTYNVTTRAVKVIPNPFTFANVAYASSFSFPYTSNVAILTGMDPWQNVNVTVSGSGEIDAGSTSSLSGVWSSTSKWANTGSSGTIYVALKVTSNSTFSSTTKAKADLNGVNSTYAVTTRPANTSPSSFNIPDVGSAELNSVYYSSFVPTNYDYATWSVTNGEGSNNNVTFGTTGTIYSGNTFYVKKTSSGSYDTPLSATITIGSNSDTWYLTTKSPPDVTPDQFYFSDVTLAEINSTYYTFLKPSGYQGSVSWTVSGGTACTTNVSTDFTTTGTITPSDTFYFKRSSSAQYGTQVSATASIGGVSDTWYITTKDPVPSTFNFSDISTAELNSTYYASVTPSGYDAATTWTVTNGTGCTTNVSTDFTNTGSISPGQTLYIRRNSSAAYSSQVSADVNIGGTTDTWYITTKDIIPNAFALSDINDAQLNSMYYASVTPSGYDASTTWTVTNGTGCTTNVSTDFTNTGSISPGQTLYVRRTSSTGYSSQVSADVNIGGTTDTWFINTRSATTSPTTFSFPQSNTGANPSTAYAYADAWGPVTISGLEKNYYPIRVTAATVAGFEGSNPLIAGATYGSALGAYSASFVDLTTDSQGRINVSPKITTGTSTSTVNKVRVTIGTQSADWSVTTKSIDTTPNPFSFVTQTGVALGTNIDSNTATISGLEVSYGSLAWSVSGNTGVSAALITGLGTPTTFGTSGTVSTDASGRISAIIRIPSSTSLNATNTATLVVGTGSGSFSVTTATTLTGPNAYTIADALSVNPNSGQGVPISLTGLTPGAQYTASVAAGNTATFSIDTNPPWSSSLTFKASLSGTATIYIQDTAPTTYNSQKSSIVSINNIKDTWLITTRAANLTPNNFTFSDVTSATLDTWYLSNIITVGGMDTYQSITITSSGSGTIAASDGTSTPIAPYVASKTVNTSSTGTVSFRANVKSNTTYSSTAGVQVSIGTVSDTYSVATPAPPSGTNTYTLVYNPTQDSTTKSLFTVPAGVTNMSILCVGGGGGGAYNGGGGAGGALAYLNNRTVSAGQQYYVYVGAGGTAGTSGYNYGGVGGDSYVTYSGSSIITAGGGAGGQINSGSGGGTGTGVALGGTIKVAGTGGGSGGTGQPKTGTSPVKYGGGGGAGGYTGTGGTGGGNGLAAAAGSGGGGGGGQFANTAQSGSGGGVGISSTRTSGTAGSTPGAHGGGGSTGTAGSASSGGSYGGGGGSGPTTAAAGAQGVVQIIYGPSQQY